jgi:ferritin-like metal-binding protein YciE
MNNMKTLKELFLGELTDMYDAEHRITKALPKLAKAATCDRLKDWGKSQKQKVRSDGRAFERGR